MVTAMVMVELLLLLQKTLRQSWQKASGPTQTIRIEQAPLKITSDTKPQEPFKM
jgi:hypothetical protein